MTALTRTHGRHRVQVRRSPLAWPVLAVGLGGWAVIGLIVWLVLR